MSQPGGRITRSRSRQANTSPKEDILISKIPHADIAVTILSPATADISSLPTDLRRKDTGLSLQDFALFQTKQRKLTLGAKRLLPKGNHSLASAAQATLVFGQAEAGTAVCVSPSGLLLTCSHCVAETRQFLDWKKVSWLLFADGRAAKAKCVAWDERRDLAALQIVAAQMSDSTDSDAYEFPHALITQTICKVETAITCTGHPGSEDLEVTEAGVPTNYPVLCLSSGSYLGASPGQDPQDNSEIGALMHDAWTYWGHSGAPLIANDTGRLIGLHSSWDDQTGTRRGIELCAIQDFLRDMHLYGSNQTVR